MTVPGESLPLLVTTVLATIRSGRPARAFLDAQREAHLTTMREFTRARPTASTEERLVLDYQIFRIEAELRWIDHATARLAPPEPEISL